MLEVDRSPEAVAFASAARAPEVSQIGAPCPDHLINTKHKPLVVDVRSRPRTAPTSSRARSGRGSTSTPTGTATTTSATSTTRRGQFPIDPAGPRVVLVPGVGIVTSGADAGRARFARDLYHRAIAVEDAADALGGFQSLSEARGVRDRVLAARALQARAGAAARRAGRPGRRRSPAARAGSAARPRALLADRGAHVVVADLNVDGAEEVAAEIARRTACAGRSPSRST